MTKFRNIAAAAALAALSLAPAGAHADDYGNRIAAGWVAPLDTNTIPMNLPTGTYLITVVGDGRTDLDCEVVDPFTGRTVAIDTDSSSSCLLTVTSRGNNVANLVIGNWGAVGSSYFVALI
jgi:hypothetical protein